MQNFANFTIYIGARNRGLFANGNPSIFQSEKNLSYETLAKLIHPKCQVKRWWEGISVQKLIESKESIHTNLHCEPSKCNNNNVQ